MQLLGLIADPQYADLPDGGVEGRTQRYRLAATKTADALAAFTASNTTAIIQLGDIIQSDKSQTTHQILTDLSTILEQFDLNTTAQQFHTLGNHCISRLSRTFVCEKLAIPTTTTTTTTSKRPPSASLFTRLMRGCSSTPSTTELPPAAYYSHDLSPRWVLIVLDTTELSGHANHPSDSEPARESAAYLASNPLSEKNPHMIPWNGGITKRQMAWLKAEIRRAERRGKLVLVACHHPIHPDSARQSHLAWNYREILKALRQSPNVRLVLSGHDHLGGGCRVTARRGKTEQVYVTVPAILEAGENENEYLVVDVDELERVTGGKPTAVAADAGSAFIAWGGPKSARIARELFL